MSFLAWPSRQGPLTEIAKGMATEEGWHGVTLESGLVWGGVASGCLNIRSSCPREFLVVLIRTLPHMPVEAQDSLLCSFLGYIGIMENKMETSILKRNGNYYVIFVFFFLGLDKG